MDRETCGTVCTKGITILGDDLFSRQPFCQLLKEKNFHFILVCKVDSHTAIYAMVDYLENNGVLGHYQNGNGMDAMAKFGAIATPITCLCVVIRRPWKSTGAN